MIQLQKDQLDEKDAMAENLNQGLRLVDAREHEDKYDDIENGNFDHPSFTKSCNNGHDY